MSNKLFLVAAVVLLISLPVVILANLRPFFYQRFDAYSVYSNFTQTKAEVDRQFEGLLQYIAPPFNSDLDPKFFSSEDRLHMQDVRTWMIVIYILTTVSLILMIGTGWARPTKANRLEKLWAIFVFAAVAFGLIAAAFWQQAFTLFHRVFFPTNKYWQLDPASSNLIKFFLNPIFLELFLLLIGGWILELLLLKLVTRLRKPKID